MDFQVDASNAKNSESLIDRIYGVCSDGLHFAVPITSSKTTEADLVLGVLQILQGLPNSLFYWDQMDQKFFAKCGTYVSHLSQKSLHAILDQFLYAATCLQLVKVVVDKMETSARLRPPTLRAFSCSVSRWLTRLRNIALAEEVKISSSDLGTAPTLLGLACSMSSLCSGAEYLLQVVHGAIPQDYLGLDAPVTAAQMAVQILDHLYEKLNEVCLVQAGEEEAYQMLLFLFVGSLLPYIEVLDSWLYDGTLDDPFQEMFFYSNKTILVDDANFWEKSYSSRPLWPHKSDAASAGKEYKSTFSTSKGKDWNNRGQYMCPLFIKDIAKSVVSAGKSLQLIRHVPRLSSAVAERDDYSDKFGNYSGASDIRQMVRGQIIGGLTLSEVFCVSLAGLTGDGDHVSKYFWQDDQFSSEIISIYEFYNKNQDFVTRNGDSFPDLSRSKKTWQKFLVDALLQKRKSDVESASDKKNKNMVSVDDDDLPFHGSLCPLNPIISVCRASLNQNKVVWNSLNISKSFNLPSLNDENLRKAIFAGKNFVAKETYYGIGFPFGQSLCHQDDIDDINAMENLFPFPTLLPPFQEDFHMSDLLPFQKSSTLPSKVLNWIQSVEPKVSRLPVVIVQECLSVYINKQVDYIGGHMLSKLMKDWRLMDELGVLRAIYLLGSGDLLQHFLAVIFSKLDKGDSWDDDFELNTILQDSIRNSADGMLLSAPDSLVVSIVKCDGASDEQHNAATSVSTPHRHRGRSFGIDGLDFLKFTYKVPWPLELIANTEAIKKYNQVMGFLLRVKQAKYVLDKARRWIWKGKVTATVSRKYHWLVEQKLLHFVDAFHQYVMDRVYHSAWGELCEGMATARSLDEVIEVHAAYLLSIQRQCFVVPDKLWALIASRINSILGLALDFYSTQYTLISGGAVSAMKGRCEMEVDRIEKQFDDCIAFLLRVLSFKLNVGQLPHLADLVTRINYNYYYMSDSGNLIAAPGAADAGSAKLSKPFSSPRTSLPGAPI